MLNNLVVKDKLYGYSIDDYDGGKGIVIADSEEVARNKVINGYLKHGYSENELYDLKVWKVTEKPFDDAPDVLEIW